MWILKASRDYVADVNWEKRRVRQELKQLKWERQAQQDPVAILGHP
jgi:hypothetical protein